MHIGKQPTALQRFNLEEDTPPTPSATFGLLARHGTDGGQPGKVRAGHGWVSLTVRDRMPASGTRAGLPKSHRRGGRRAPMPVGYRRKERALGRTARLDPKDRALPGQLLLRG